MIESEESALTCAWLISPGGEATRNARAAVRQVARQESQQPFDLGQGPLLRAMLLLGQRSTRLCCC